MQNILSVKNLSIEVNQRTLIQDISFDIGQDEVVLLSGENGIGKSTILKSIMRLETKGKKINGEILHHKFGNIITLSDKKLQRFRASIGYIQQKDNYSEMGNIQVRDIISDSAKAHSSSAKVNALIDEWLPRRKDKSRFFEAESKPAKLSGGEQRLLSVFSIIATRHDSDLLIIDEPLNNLDFKNAKTISNLINKVIKNNPQMAVLMVSHCRIFPFITREIRLTSNGIKNCNNYTYHSCFGKPNDEGFYI